ncbi:MAG: DNA mismatch repair protein MutS [bacterium]
MLQQYLDAKERYPDTILFFRMGDFYEMFFEDAVTASRVLGLTLTARNKGDVDEVPMAGVPHHAASGYISGLIESGFAVAICEQLEDPAQAKGIVRRDVVRVITPGVVMDTESLDARASNYVAAIHMGKDTYGVAYVDVSTGRFHVTEAATLGELASEIGRIEPREILVNDVEAASALEGRWPGSFLRRRDAAFFDARNLYRAAQDAIRLEREMAADGFFMDRKGIEALVTGFAEFAFRDPERVRGAAFAVLRYIVDTQRGIPSHLRPAEPYHIREFLIVDASTKANLELTETLMGGKRSGSLLSVIDKTLTAMGGRTLRHWLNYPLVNPDTIASRLDAVDEIVKRTSWREDLRGHLANVYDIERLCGRISSGTANARDLRSLLSTLGAIEPIKHELNSATSKGLVKLNAGIDPFTEMRARVDGAIVDAPPVTLTEGGIFRRGFDADLDELIELTENGKDWILRFEQKEKERTQISSLKVRYNKVFGYYIEITRANLESTPDDYIRKQTLANAERYFTPELKEMEDKILGAEDKRKSLEYRLFEALRAEVAGHVAELMSSAQNLAELDVLVGFAELAVRHDYVRPTVDSGDAILIEDGRHPVVERTLSEGRFVPNSVEIGGDEPFLQIITGPNMAGKSTVIRQVALITLMAQMGSFVPASRAHLGVVDKIFSRVGASDNLARGQSTFMVEMTETAHILNNATRKSLIILDEIGRGTSTFDGLSIAWAVAEHLHDVIGAKTMFATHYHELTELVRTLEGAENLSIAVKEWQDDIIFLRKVVRGQANRSYGVQVGRLAGLPPTVVTRAKEVLSNLESVQFDERGVPLAGRHAGRAPQVTLRNNPDQLTLFSGSALSPAQEAVIDSLKTTDVDALTPLQALNLLAELKQKLE